MFNLHSIIRPSVQALEPYRCARDDYKGLAAISMDANENPFGFGLNRYPDASLSKLKKAFANYKNVDPDQLIFGNGSDELIDLLIRAFCEPGRDKILIFPPTFGMYATCAAINNVEIISQCLTDSLQIDFEALRPGLSDPNLHIIFICSPNNPTGNKVNDNTIKAISDNFAGLIVVDEAYGDFTDSSRIDQNTPGIFTLHTFSKAFGLAGIRLGAGIGNPKVIEALNKIKPPYNVNSITQKKAIEALKRSDEIKKQVQVLVEEREKLKLSLSRIPSVKKVFPSEANFLLVVFEDAKTTYDQLILKGIAVRDRSGQVSNSLRITIGTPEENRQLVAALKGENDVHEGRIGRNVRTTSETQIRVEINLDNPSESVIVTGIAFFDHMLEQVAGHGAIGLHIQVKGDLHIDAHHTIEDTALALGSAFNEALGARKGIERYGFLLPMDDCLAQVAIDFGGRPWLEWDVCFKSAYIGEMPTEMTSHFFKSFSDTARCNINIKAEGENDHHKIESIFKAFARAIKMAVKRDEKGLLPSTKGIL